MADGIWRVEDHPKREGEFIAVRVSDDVQLGPKREVATIKGQLGREKVQAWDDERTAQIWCDRMNPAPTPREGSALSPSQLEWLERLANAEEGRMERSTSTTLLALEHLGLATSRPEPNRRLMDRWTITKAGRKALAEEKD